ncbi:AsmA family protein [Stappia sp. 22II-S9-Z10]|nr:AsmA family protein [Stappia sp. 22II-S9-Z10]
MNWFIISIGVAIVLALATATVGPHFVDWAAYRVAIERNAERAIGTDVAFTGDADLVLLPRPRLRVENVSVGPAERPLMVAAAVEMRMELTPLLKREIRVKELTVEAPTLYARITPQGRMELPDLTARRMIASYVDTANVAIDTVRLSDATLVVADERTGVERRLEHISLNGSARSLRGPFTVAGEIVSAGRKVAFTLGTGALADGTLPLSARLMPEGLPVAFAFDGALSPQPAAPGLAGRFEISSETATPWSINGDMALDTEALRLGRATLTYGAGETPLQMTGRAIYALTRSDPLALTFEARQIDLDRVARALRPGPDGDAAASDAPPDDAANDGLSVAPGGTPAVTAAAVGVPSEMLPRLAARIAPALGGLGGLPLPDVPITADIDIGTLIAGGAVSRDVSVRLSTGATGLMLDRAEALLPGDTSVETSGRFTGAGYAGSLKISASQPSIFAHWWSGEAFAGAVVDPVLMEADIDIGREGFDARRLSLRIGDSRATGRWQSGMRDGRREVAISLGAPLVDVDDVIDAAAILPRGLLPSDGTDVTLDLSIDRILVGNVEGASLNVDASYADGTLNIDAIQAEKLGGVSLFAVGQLGDLAGEPVGSINGTLKVLDGDALAASVRQLLPLSASARRFASLAPALSPGDFTFRIVGDTAPDAADLTVALNGSANGTAVALTAAGTPSHGAWAAEPLSIALELTNADGAILARQFGLGAPPTEEPGRLSLTASGTLNEGASAALTASGFGSTVRYEGTVRHDGAFGLTGRLSADARSLSAWETLLGVRLPVVAGLSLAADIARAEAGGLSVTGLDGIVDGVPVSGSLQVGADGAAGELKVTSANLEDLAALVLGPEAFTPAPSGEAWPSTTFARVDGSPVPLSLEVRAGTLMAGDRRLEDARFSLDLGPGRLALSGLSARYAGGRLEGGLDITRDGAAAALDGEIALDGARLAPLVWRADGAPVASGTLSFGARVSSEGYTVADLVTGLSGAGSLTLTDGRLAAFNTAPFDWDDASGDAPDDAAVRADFLAHLTGEATRFDRLAADLTIENGALRLSRVTAEPALDWTVEDVRADLGAWRLRAGLSLRTVVSGQPAVPIGVSFDGAISAPEQSVDVSRLTSWAALRSIERQVEAVESDNEALAREADAAGAPTSDALGRLGLGADGAAAPGSGDTPADRGSPAADPPAEGATSPGAGRETRSDRSEAPTGRLPRRDAADDHAALAPRSAAAGMTASGAAKPDVSASATTTAGAGVEAGSARAAPIPAIYSELLPPSSAAAQEGTRPAPSRLPSAASADRPDALGDYLRQMKRLDNDLTDYESRRAARQPIADALQETLRVHIRTRSASAAAPGPAFDHDGTGAAIGADNADLPADDAAYDARTGHFRMEGNAAAR